MSADRKLAREKGQLIAAVSAVMGLAKIHGLILDKAQISGNDESPVVTRIELVPVIAKQILEELDGIAGGPNNPIPQNH